MPVIRYPDSTKNTSTPTKPAENPGTARWAPMTNKMATARMPSISLRKYLLLVYMKGLCCVGGRFYMRKERVGGLIVAQKNAPPGRAGLVFRVGLAESANPCYPILTAAGREVFARDVLAGTRPSDTAAIRVR